MRRRASGRVHYNYFKDYDPATGRYSKSDRIGLRGGIKAYGYAFGNPISWIDPYGLEAGTHTLPRRRPPIRIPIPGWLGPAGELAGAGWLGWEFGSWLYPHIAIPLGDAIDRVCKDDVDECEETLNAEVDSCYEQFEDLGPEADWMRSACIDRAKKRFKACNGNGGTMPPDAPAPWGDQDVDGWGRR